jgi:hypothetical protein
MNHKDFFRTPAMVALSVITAASLYAADIRRLTLTEAVHLAIGQNRALRSRASR